MTLFLEIIESDGASVDAQDEGNIVIAALENWGLLATEIDDLEAWEARYVSLLMVQHDVARM